MSSAATTARKATTTQGSHHSGSGQPPRPAPEVKEHWAIHRLPSGWWGVIRWDRRAGVWVPQPGYQDTTKPIAFNAVSDGVRFGHVTVTDRTLELEGLTLLNMDTISSGQTRTYFCPEGDPTHPDLWTTVTIELGTLNRDGSMSSIGPHSRFMEQQLAEQFEALVAPHAAWDNRAVHTRQSYAVRRDVTARQLLPQENWGIVGKPDVLARQQAESEARARAEAEAD